jgi:hypothetical protein
MEKITIPHRVAEEIRTLRIGLGWTNEQVLNRQFLLEEECEAIVNYIDESIENTHKYYLAVTQGYEVELTPEERVREYYEGLVKTICEELDMETKDCAKAEAAGVRTTLRLLGIEMNGVNA